MEFVLDNALVCRKTPLISISCAVGGSFDITFGGGCPGETLFPADVRSVPPMYQSSEGEGAMVGDHPGRGVCDCDGEGGERGTAE